MRLHCLLQAQLPSHFEVLNFGRPGANTPEHRTLVEELLPKIHPDFILLQWYINDVEGDSSEGRPTFRPLIPYVPLHNFLNSESAFYTVATMKWAETQVALGMTTSYSDYLKRRFTDPNSRDSKLDRAELEKLIATAREERSALSEMLNSLTTRSAKLMPMSKSLDQLVEKASAAGTRLDDIGRPFRSGADDVDRRATACLGCGSNTLDEDDDDYRAPCLSGISFDRVCFGCSTCRGAGPAPQRHQHRDQRHVHQCNLMSE